MTENYINVADFFNSHLSEVKLVNSSNYSNKQLVYSSNNQDMNIEQWSICQEFCNKIEILNLKRVSNYDIFHNGVKQICLHGKTILTVRYTIRIQYIDTFDCCKDVLKDEYVVFNDLPDHFCVEYYILNIPNRLDIEICGDDVIASGTIRLRRKHRCRHEFSDDCHDWNEWNQHSKPCYRRQ